VLLRITQIVRTWDDVFYEHCQCQRHKTLQLNKSYGYNFTFVYRVETENILLKTIDKVCQIQIECSEFH